MCSKLASSPFAQALQYVTLYCQWYVWASLSEPHTSVTALRMCVCMYACLLAWTDHLPEILNKHLYILILRKLSSCTWRVIVKSIARVQRRLPVVETTEVEAHMATYCLFATNQRQLAHKQYNFDHDGG